MLNLFNFLPKNKSELVGPGVGAYCLARVSLVALIETFAFFFLNVHRFGLGERTISATSYPTSIVLGLHILKALGDIDWRPDRMAPSRPVWKDHYALTLFPLS
jgi:hypothetical protein